MNALHCSHNSRFQLTNERDVTQDPSLLYSPTGLGQPQPSFVREPPLFQSTPERQHSVTTINQYGYDVHEVQTSGWFVRLGLLQIDCLLRRGRPGGRNPWSGERNVGPKFGGGEQCRTTAENTARPDETATATALLHPETAAGNRGGDLVAKKSIFGKVGRCNWIFMTVPIFVPRWEQFVNGSR